MEGGGKGRREEKGGGMGLYERGGAGVMMVGRWFDMKSLLQPPPVTINSTA